MEGLPPSVVELANALHEFVNINDVQEPDSTSDVDNPNKSGGPEVSCNQKCLSRYVSFPSPAKMISDYSSSDKEDEATVMTSEKLIFHEPAPPVKLVSALKGSREKQGFPPEKLQVTWAPDVYDPIPTSVSHAGQRGTRQQKLSRKDKRRGKKGNKGKDLPKGDGGSKDKKKKRKKKRSSQSTVIPGTSYNGSNELEHKSEMVENFGFGVSDSCGSSNSFFKLSMTNAHYPVAEAL